MKRITRVYLLTLAVGIGLGWTAGMEASAAGPNPCSDDIARFCPGSKPGPAGMVALMECLEQHEKELSEACRNFEAKMGGPRTEREEVVREKRRFRERCIDDMVTFCKDASPTQGGMIRCLDEHAEQLSVPCRESLKAIK